MSKISRFSQDLSAELKTRTERHRATSKARYSRAAEIYQRGIEAKRAENNRRHSRSSNEMSKAVFRPYLWSLGGLLLTAAVLLGMNFYLASKIADQKVEYQAAKAATEKLDQYSKKIQLSTCTTKNKQDVPCVAIQPNSPQWGKNGEYRAILPRPSK